MDTIVYRIENKLYINLTNKCSNNCSFCVRNTHEGVEGYYLWLKNEPSAEEIIKQLEKAEAYDEVVFCGFGEPLYKLEVILEVADHVKKQGKKTRLNTNGQAGLIIGEGVAQMLKGKINKVNISLNSTDAKKYAEICNPIYGEAAYEDMLKFASECVKVGIDTVLSVVEIIGEEEIEKAREIASSVGGRLRVRKFID